MRSLFGILAVRHRGFVVAAAILLGLFQFLICAAVSSVNLGGLFESVTRNLPPFLQALVSSQLLGGFSAHGLVAFGWNHPVSHALGTAPAIVLASGAIAGEIETGAIELVLSQPLSRASYFIGQILFAAASLALVSLTGLLGTVLGQRAFHMEPFGHGPLLALATDYALLMIAAFGITMLFSAWGREGGRVASAGFAIVLLSYFAQAIGRLWTRAAWILPWTLHDSFVPQKILVEHAAAGRQLAVLGSVAIVALGLAWARFRTRDLP
jgi:ABC-type transport system involved in multi-copper enzyme maturation permease subunit